jgi:hypothetical protein
MLDCGGTGRRAADTDLQPQHQRSVVCSMTIEKGEQNITLQQGKSATMPDGKTFSKSLLLQLCLLIWKLERTIH